MVTYRCPGKTLSALVARTTEPGQLVELARYVGDITGLRLGVRVNINHLTGAIMGSVLRGQGSESQAFGTRCGGRGRGSA